MADGTLNFDTAILTAGFEKGIDSIGDGIGRIKDKLIDLGDVFNEVFSIDGLLTGGLGKMVGLVNKIIGNSLINLFEVSSIDSLISQSKSLYNIQLEAETKLAAVMRQRLGATDESIQKIKDYASELQSIGVIGDEVALSGAQQLTTFLTQEQAIKTLLPAMENLIAQQKGLSASTSDAVSVANLMGKVMQGQTAALTRVGVTFSETEEEVLKNGSELERAAMLAQVITNNLGEMNQALAQTPAGQIQQLSNSIGDIKEQIGDVIIQLSSIFLPNLNELVGILSKAASYAQTLAHSLAVAFGSVTSDTSDTSQNISQSVSNQQELTDAVKETEKAQKGVLAGFDELNILTSKSYSDGSEDAGNVSDGVIIPTVEIPDTSGLEEELKKRFEKMIIPIKAVWEDNSPELEKNVKRAVKNIKNLFSSIGETIEEVFTNGTAANFVGSLIGLFSVLAGIIGDIAGTLDTVWSSGAGLDLVESLISRWTALINLINSVGNSFRNAWNSGTGEKIVTNIFKIFTNINNTITNITDKFREAWEKAGLGDSIMQHILNIVLMISGFIRKLTEDTAEWAKNLDFTPLLESINNWLGALGPYLGVCLTVAEKLFKEVLLPALKWLIEEGLPFLINLWAESLNGAVGLLEMLVKFWGSIKEKWEKIKEFGSNVSEFFSGLWEDVKSIFSDLSTWFSEKFSSAYDAATSPFRLIADWFGDRWKNIKEKLHNVGEWFGKTFDAAYNWVKSIFEPIADWFSEKWRDIKNALSEVGEWFGGKFSDAWENIKKAFSHVTSFFSGVWEGIKGIFSHVTTWFGEKFANAWQAVLGVFNSSGVIFDGIVDGIFNVFRDVVNGLISGINWVVAIPFDGINAALDGLRGISILGTTPFDWLPYISIPQIPYLAQGTVVPANYGEFLAVLGDNKREAEVVSPLSTMKEAVAEVLAGMLPKELAVTTHLYPDSRAYHREIIKIINDDRKRGGY